jgi:acyl carrier protein
VEARAYACDVADEAQLRRTLGRIRHDQGSLAGVLHAAMVLDDAALADLDTARFTAVIRPKLAGAAALDRLTRGDALDLFVLFSSVTTVIGTPGQASYVAANAALEALAERRHAAGLPALAVQWGPIGDAGYLARENRVADMLAKMLGSTHLRAADALEALPALLACGRSTVGLADIAWGDLRARLPGLAGPFWSEMPATVRAGESVESIRARLAGLSPDAAAQVILDVLVEELAAILRHTPSAIDVNRPVAEFGVDSLMGVELRTALESRLGVPLPLLTLSGVATLRAMSVRLLAVLHDGAPAPADDLAADDLAADDLAAAILRHEGAPLPAAAEAMPGP